MPAPERTTIERVVVAASGLVEAVGHEALTMQAVADRVGVRAPSLYKRVRSREHLLGLVVDQATRDLAQTLDDAAAAEPDPQRRLVAIATALRGFAHVHPRLFFTLMAPLPPAARASREALERSSAALLAACTALVGPDRALDAARTVTAWAFGFLTMELTGAFQLGGQPDEAFAFGAKAIARSIGAAPTLAR